MIKLKKRNPNEFSSRELSDIKDALETAKEGDYISPDSTISDFTVTRKTLSLKEILTYDDYSSWGQWNKNELINLSESELFDELLSYRGKKWAERVLFWLKNKSIPPIVIFSDIPLIGDGRGRVSLAVGMGINKLQTLLLESK